MLLLFGINLKKQTKNLKIHTQERKVATYTSTNLKSRFFFFFKTMAHGITCTQLLGKEMKNGNGKEGLPGWPYQNEDDAKGAGGT